MAQLEIVQVTKEDLEKFIREAIKKELSQFEPLLETLVFRQKDVARLANVSSSTVANKIARGLVPYLAEDGSRRNYVTLKTVNDLKPRIKRSRRLE